MNITIDDSSPLWTWSPGQWYDDHDDGTPSPDGATDLYFQESFHSTFGKNAAASITFRGTAVYVYGGRNNNHGAYSGKSRLSTTRVTTDGKAGIDLDSPVTMSGYSATRMFQQLLWSATDLSADTDHTLTMTNVPALTDGYDGVSEYWLDIDYVIVTAPVPSGSSVETTTFDDSQSSVFTYSNGDWTPETTWQAYSQDTAHLAIADGATVEFTFYGHSVELVGGVNTDHGNYSVAIDGGTPSMYNGTRFSQMTYVPLFIASGLEEGQHTITMTNHAVSAAEYMMDIDYAVVNSTSGTQTTSLASGMTSASGTALATSSGQTTSVGTASMTVSDGITVSLTSTTTAQRLEQTAYSMVVGAAGSPELKAQPLPDVDTALGASTASQSFFSTPAGKFAILGGCAGLLALLLLVGGVWWCRKRDFVRRTRTWNGCRTPNRYLTARDDIDELTPLSARWDKPYIKSMTKASPYAVDSVNTWDWPDSARVCRATKVRATTAATVTMLPSQRA